jgi:hypothetical protein
VTWYEPTATVVHFKAGTSGSVCSPRLTRAFHYGMYRFYPKHCAPQRNPAANAAVYYGIAAKLGLTLVKDTARRRRRRRGLPREWVDGKTA